MREALRKHTEENWVARCLTCGVAFPYPGIRYRAAGEPRQLRRCPRCGRLRCCKIERRRDRDAGPAAGADASN